MRWMAYIFLMHSLISFSQEPYQFFVAGHVYGAAGVNNAAFHPPFQSALDSLNANEAVDFGYFTGDIVSPNPTAQDWNEVDSVLNLVNFPVYFVAGNHDYENISEFTGRYGQTYSARTYQNDLFITLDANLTNWNIEGYQLDSLKYYLESYPNVDNIFLFVHQVIWYEPDGKHSNHTPNSLVGYQDSTNFWNEIVPLLNAQNKACYLFAGDVGVYDFTTSIAYQRIGNLHLICSGMGGAENENYIVVSVDENKLTEFEVDCLNPLATNCPEDIRELMPIDAPNIYPNPVSTELFIEVDHAIETNIELYNAQGQLMLISTAKGETLAKVDVSTLEAGKYTLVVNNGSHLSRQGVIVVH